MSALIRSVTQGLIRAIRILMALLRANFGEIRWSPPSWMGRTWHATSRFASRIAGGLADSKRRDPRKFWISSAAILTFAVASGIAVRWYVTRPEPRYVEISVFPPHGTPLTPDAKIDPLRLIFSASAARIGTVGKTVNQGIDIEPPLSGVWKWETDAELTFTPRDDWEVGRGYTISLSHQIFAPQALLKSYSQQFRSPSFESAYSTAEFYEDPTDPKNKRGVATFGFSHPIDKADLEKRISLRMRTEPIKSLDSREARSFGFTVSYDKTGSIAYIHSDPFAIPERDAAMLVEIAAGVHSARGGPGTATALSQVVQIPGIATYFQIQNVSAQAVANQNDEMERIATVISSVPLKQQDLADSIAVVMLPKDCPAIGDQKLEKDFPWSDPTEVVPDAMALATPVPIQWLPSEREFNPLQSFKFTADRGRYLLVIVRRGLIGFGGYRLSKDVSQVIAVPEFPNLIKIASTGSLLSLSGEHKISIVSRGIDAMQIEVSRLLPGSVSHLVSQTSGGFSEPSFWSSEFGYDVRCRPFSQPFRVQQSPSRPHDR